MSQRMDMSQKGMLSNNVYDLIEQLSIESQSLWRIRNNYRNDSQNDTEAQSFWDSLEREKQDNIRRLTELIATRM